MTTALRSARGENLISIAVTLGLLWSCCAATSGSAIASAEIRRSRLRAVKTSLRWRIAFLMNLGRRLVSSKTLIRYSPRMAMASKLRLPKNMMTTMMVEIP